ncbi:MAG: sugar phosphate isomerase/epimerase [Clostridia bacterium]|nr:sugar phosphate isomerase/epimerase [Clostridia bacterium]
MSEIKLGVQLYTLRDQCKNAEDFETTLKFLQSIGCNVIQISAIGDIDPIVVGELVDKYNMEVCLTHKSYDRMKNDLPALMREHDLIHCKNIGIGAMPGNIHQTPEGVTGFIAKCNEIGRAMHDEGKQLCYHNHAFEFEVYDGMRTFERLINETTPETLHFVPDVYWMQVGGVNPAEYMKKLAGRVEVCHFKDMCIVDNQQRFAECGTGNIDLGACYRTCKEIGVKYIVIEQDLCYDKHPYEAVRIGFEGLKRIAEENR